MSELLKPPGRSRPQRAQPVQRNAAEDHAQHGEDGVDGLIRDAQHEIEEQDRQAE